MECTQSVESGMHGNNKRSYRRHTTKLECAQYGTTGSGVTARGVVLLWLKTSSNTILVKLSAFGTMFLWIDNFDLCFQKDHVFFLDLFTGRKRKPKGNKKENQKIITTAFPWTLANMVTYAY